MFFFFQAEDGIRDKLVTGVQTCALPICPPPAPAALPRRTARHAPRSPFLGEWPGAPAPSTRRGRGPRNARAGGRRPRARKDEAAWPQASHAASPGPYPKNASRGCRIAGLHRRPVTLLELLAPAARARVVAAYSGEAIRHQVAHGRAT